MQVADAIVRDAIDYKRAALLLYALQIASANLKRVSLRALTQPRSFALLRTGSLDGLDDDGKKPPWAENPLSLQDSGLCG